MRLRFVLLLGGMAASASLWAAAPTPAMLSNPCAGCHGTNGTSAGPNAPSLAGQPAAYLVESMKKFKSGERPSSIMGRLAKGYTDEEFGAMGEFFSRQKSIRPRQETDAAKVARGRRLHEQNCHECHKEDGREARNGAVLAGQWKEYLDLAMGEFQSGKRPMPKKMAEKIQRLNREQVDALSHYYASQH